MTVADVHMVMMCRMARSGIVVDEYLDDEGNGDQPREIVDHRLDCMGVYLDDRR